jgi:serine/threonine protein kinase/tetratricopeptide (TPR) repeat protein
VKTNGKRACEVCGTALSENSEFCPVCALQGAISPGTESLSAISSELCFEHYQVLKNEDGTPIELGRGGMGLTYKAIDTHLRCPVALKIISAQFIGNEFARSRFLREARAAASVHHPNVATVHHLGESGGNYFYAMEFVDGETLEALIHRRSRLEIELALEIVVQVAAGLTAIHKQHLVHRDIKPSNIMVTWEEGRLENVKIIDLGLAKGVTEDTLSIAGSFIGTPTYASPEQFAGLGADIRSDLYSLGVTLWEMLSCKPPFHGSAAELMDQHQRAAPPLVKLRNIPEPIIALLEVLLAKDPSQRFQSPAQLQKALTKVREATGSGVRLTADELRSVDTQVTANTSKRKPRRQAVRWLLGTCLCLAGGVIAWFCFFPHAGLLSNQRVNEAVPTEKSIAVLPFESLSADKEDTYFADGVQDDILNDLAKIAQLTVISRTSVMLYRAGEKRDLRQISSALGVANVLEGTVRRNANRVRVNAELIDARQDKTIWADSFDRDLTDIFAIQSEVAQTIATKLAATLSPEEKRNIEKKPTENLEAYELYLRAKESLLIAFTFIALGNAQKPSLAAISLLDQAIQLDPKFTLAYCRLAEAQGLLYWVYDATPERLALADAAISHALALEPDLPEVHLACAEHLYRCYRDYEHAREQLAIAMRGLPNNAEAIGLGALIDRRQGQWEKAIQAFKDAITRDPHNSAFVENLASTFWALRQFRAAEQMYDRLVELRPNEPILKPEKAVVNYWETGDDTPVKAALAALPASMADDRDALNLKLLFALVDRDWTQAKEGIQKLNGGDDNGGFAYAPAHVPVGCYSILLSRLQGEQTDANTRFAQTREQLDQRVQKAPESALLLSQLAVVDALLNHKETAIAEAKRAVELLPISKDAVLGPQIQINLAVVYAWTNESDLAFGTLSSSAQVPYGIFYGPLKRDPYWEPLRQDPRYEKLLAKLAPRD